MRVKQLKENCLLEFSKPKTVGYRIGGLRVVLDK